MTPKRTKTDIHRRTFLMGMVGASALAVARGGSALAQVQAGAQEKFIMGYGSGT